MRFELISKNIINIILPDTKSLCDTMIRFQEHFESPHPEIKGKVFTTGYLKHIESMNGRGVNTYSGGFNFNPDWAGFNFPSYVVEPFVQGLFEPLTEAESDVIKALRYRTGKFYVIGTDETNQGSVKDHEIAHAIYYLEDGYKKEIDKVLNRYNLKKLKSVIKNKGYCEEVLDDECQAFLGSNLDEVLDFMKSKINNKEKESLIKCSTEISKIFKKWKKKLNIS